MFNKIIITFTAIFCILICQANNIKNNVVFAYPNWKLKALSFSYDDAHIADRQLVAIFNKYNMKATFHIPHAWLTTKPEKRITEAEINTLYKGHEVAGHGANHLPLKKLKKYEVDAEIKADIDGWKKITGKTLIGYAYPGGSYSQKVISVLKNNGIIYSRIVGRDTTFSLPENFLIWTPTSHHTGNISTLGEKYLNLKPEKMTVMIVWGHSYEFPRKNNWHVIEDFCRQMCGKDDIFYATMENIASYVIACRNAFIANDGKTLKNNSDKRLYFFYKGKKITVEKNSEYIL